MSDILPCHPTRQCTIRRPVGLRGRGYLSGVAVELTFHPAPPETGVVFVRTDLPGRPEIPAVIDSVIPRQRRTAIARGDAVVEMVEHVMAALTGLGIDNCRVEITAPETPGCDGSSQAFVECLLEAGIMEQDAPARFWRVDRPIMVTEGVMTLLAEPLAEPVFKLNYTLDYPSAPVIGRQAHEFTLRPGAFARELATARTFVLDTEVPLLHAAGIGRHCTVQDLLIFGPDGPIENTLRFENEPVRHKMLDVVGDLSLLGCRLQGQFTAYRSGHTLNADMVRALRHAMEESGTQLLRTA